MRSQRQCSLTYCLVLLALDILCDALYLDHAATSRHEWLTHGHESCDEGGAEPEDHSDDHDPLPGVAVAGPAEDGGGGEVEDDEGRLDEAALPVLQLPLLLDVVQHAWKERARGGLKPASFPLRPFV